MWGKEIEIHSGKMHLFIWYSVSRFLYLNSQYKCPSIITILLYVKKKLVQLSFLPFAHNTSLLVIDEPHIGDMMVIEIR